MSCGPVWMYFSMYPNVFNLCLQLKTMGYIGISLAVCHLTCDEQKLFRNTVSIKHNIMEISDLDLQEPLSVIEKPIRLLNNTGSCFEVFPEPSKILLNIWMRN